MRFNALADLPEKHTCLKCGKEKLLIEMIVIHERKTGNYLLRGCKECNNKKERGHRRQWKRDYLRAWRKRNAELTESYWRQSAILNREKTNAQACARFQKKHDALLIQGRLRRHGMKVGIFEAQQLLKKFGPCYPMRPGLTPEGFKECERLRSVYRRLGKPYNTFEIRLMVYEDGFFIKPSRQKTPYRTAAANLRKWHKERAA
jgi:hypothetical protein